MNRHHYALYVHNCRLVFLLRKDFDQADTFRPAEFHWKLDQVWHSGLPSPQLPLSRAVGVLQCWEQPGGSSKYCSLAEFWKNQLRETHSILSQEKNCSCKPSWGWEGYVSPLGPPPAGGGPVHKYPVLLLLLNPLDTGLFGPHAQFVIPLAHLYIISTPASSVRLSYLLWVMVQPCFWSQRMRTRDPTTLM